MRQQGMTDARRENIMYSLRMILANSAAVCTSLQVHKVGVEFSFGGDALLALAASAGLVTGTVGQFYTRGIFS